MHTRHYNWVDGESRGEGCKNWGGGNVIVTVGMPVSHAYPQLSCQMQCNLLLLYGPFNISLHSGHIKSKIRSYVERHKNYILFTV